jgi:hypothetical protein
MLSGANFDIADADGPLTCFLNGSSPAVSISATLAACSVPNGLPGGAPFAPVPVGLDAHTQPASYVSQLLVIAPTITSLSPAVGSASGGTSIVVGGSGFRCGVTPQCVFGQDLRVAATVLSDAALLCVSPSLGRVATVRFGVTWNGLDIITSGVVAASQFSFVALPLIGAVLPAAVLRVSGVLLSVTGTGFAGTHALQCRFSNDLETLFTALTVVSDTSGTCLAPAFCVSCVQAGAYQVGITRDGADIAGGVALSVVEPPVISAIVPTRGPAAGGTLLTVLGTRLAALGSAPLCRVGAAVVAGVQSTVNGSVAVLCETPASWPRVTVVEVG